MQAAPETPSDFDMIIENAEGDKNQIVFEYPNIQPNNAILMNWKLRSGYRRKYTYWSKFKWRNRGIESSIENNGAD